MNSFTKEEALKIWEDFFQDKEFTFDFANKLIIKEEFNTNKIYSWNIDFYDQNDKQNYFIANCESIKLRDKKPIFNINNETFFVVKNFNSKYKIINLDKINDHLDPFELDLNFINKLKELDNTNEDNQNNFIICLSYRKLKDKFNNLFISFLQKYLNLFNLSYLSQYYFDNEFKNKVFFIFEKDKIEIKEFLDLSLKIHALIKLMFYRMKNKNIFDSQAIDKNYFFNLVLFSTNSIYKINENIEHNLLFSYTEVLENKIFLNYLIYSLLLKINFNKNDFKLIERTTNETQNIYLYNFTDSKIATYLNEIIKLENNKKN